MHLTPARVAAERDWIVDHDETIVPIINDVRDDLSATFDTTVDHVTTEQYRDEVAVVFADGDLAVNVAAMTAICAISTSKATIPASSSTNCSGANSPRPSLAPNHCGPSAKRPSTTPICKSTAVPRKTPALTTSRPHSRLAFRSASRMGLDSERKSVQPRVALLVGVFVAIVRFVASIRVAISIVLDRLFTAVVWLDRWLLLLLLLEHAAVLLAGHQSRDLAVSKEFHESLVRPIEQQCTLLGNACFDRNIVVSGHLRLELDSVGTDQFDLALLELHLGFLLVEFTLLEFRHDLLLELLEGFRIWLDDCGNTVFRIAVGFGVGSSSASLSVWGSAPLSSWLPGMSNWLQPASDAVAPTPLNWRRRRRVGLDSIRSGFRLNRNKSISLYCPHVPDSTAVGTGRFYPQARYQQAVTRSEDETRVDTLERPSLEAARETIASGIAREALVTAFGRCRVEYDGRAASSLAAGDRHVMCKPDGTILVHTDEGQKPVNWQPPGCEHTVELVEGEADTTESALILESTRSTPEERLRVTFETVLCVSVFAGTDDTDLSLVGTEEDLRERILETPDLLESGFTPLATERATPAGAVDIYGEDSAAARLSSNSNVAASAPTP